MELQTVVIELANAGDSCALYMPRIIAFREALSKHIHAIQNIPDYYEQSKKTRNNKIFEFTFPRWNQSAGVKVYRNGQIINDGFEIDYLRGRVVFNHALLKQDIVNVDYNFRWFSDDDLDRFLDNALEVMNSYPPSSAYGLYNVPDRHIPVILYGAAKDALRTLMMELMTQEPSQVFGGGEKAERTFQMMETLKKNYEADWKEILGQKKFGPYPHSVAISTPEYTLPGGRSRWFRYMFGNGGIG